MTKWAMTIDGLRAQHDLRVKGRPRVASCGLDQQALVNAQGHIAVLTSLGEIKLIRPSGAITVSGRDSVLPGTDAPAFFGPTFTRILAFNNRDDILFRLRFENRLGFFLWQNGRLKKVGLSGEVLADGRSFGPAADDEAADMNDAGLIVFKGDGLFFYDGTLRPVFRSDERRPGLLTQWLHVTSVDINGQGLVAFATNAVAGLFDGREIKILAEFDHRVPDRNFRITNFLRARVNESGWVFFTAENSDPIGRGTALFVYDTKSVRPLLFGGDPLPGQLQKVLGEIDSVRLPRSPFAINDANELVLWNLFADPARPNEWGEAGFVRVDAPGKARVIVAQRSTMANFPVDLRDLQRDFHWDNSSRLLFTARLGPWGDRGLFLWNKGEVATVIQDGDRISPPANRSLALVAALVGASGLSDSGILLFQACVAGRGPSGLFAGVPGHFEQRHLPQLAAGRFGPVRVESHLLLHNKSDSPATISIDLLHPDGTGRPAWKRVALQPRQATSVRLDVADSFLGWGRVNVEGGEAAVFARLALLDGARLLSEVTVPASLLLSEAFLAGNFQRDEDVGLALANPYTLPIEVEVDFLGRGLQTLQRVKLSLPAGGQTARLISELFPGQIWRGPVRVRSPLPLPALVLRLDGPKLTSQPID